MGLQVIQVLEPMLAIATTFMIAASHNILALQLDPRYKGVQVVIE